MKAPAYSLHTITLEIRVPRDGVASPPEAWDWPALLDLPDRDDVRVVEAADAEAKADAEASRLRNLIAEQHDGTALTRLYAQLRDNYDELLTERDNLQTMADVAFRELDAVRDERDEARAEADRLREAGHTLDGLFGLHIHRNETLPHDEVRAAIAAWRRAALDGGDR